MVKFPDPATANPAFADDVINGLSQRQKFLPSRWLYDEAGSQLFEEITELDEYYPARAETLILESFGREMAAFVGREAALVEYGSGSGRKTQLLLDRLMAPAAYMPIDISQQMLAAARAAMARRFPHIQTIPVVADFMQPLDLPRPLLRFDRRAGFFPGSTIGNLSRIEAVALLGQMRRHLGPSGRAIIGFDLIKDVDRMIRAYDDRLGVTAAFNRNILARINREVGANFDLSKFTHQARWNAAKTRMEMHLASSGAQSVRVAGYVFSFDDNETIHTENSRKYDLDQITHLAAEAGWRVDTVWTDPGRLFAVVGLAQSGGTERARAGDVS
jgi:dimethylhistidine N-methyltransferase